MKYNKKNLERAPTRTERKLAAILSADVKGYSRLMGEDEVGTLRTLTAYREVLAILIEQHRGRVVNFVGDNFLAEFASAVDAVQCAQEIQRVLKEQNAQLPAQRRMEFRIGINVGDVLVEDGQLYGDGVNIAARMEQLAEAGGICLSGTAYDQVVNKLVLTCEYLGEQTVKNIAQPIRVYQVWTEPKADVKVSADQRGQQLFFSPFQLDMVNGCLWRGKKRIALTPKDFAVLRHLVTHAGQLVTHEELLQRAWPGVKVSPGVLKVCLRRIRQVLGDPATAPRFIETKHRQGYRFIAPLATTPPVSSFKFQVSSSETTPTPNTQHPTPLLVDREAELARLHTALEKALQGERQIVFVTGEPGIGKTTVVRAFLEQVAARDGVAIGHGQCIEHYGPGEAYLPVLEALGRLCRAPGGERCVQWLTQHAPTWLVQMPALLKAPDLEALQRKAQGATRERMLREMIEAVEMLTERQPFVLVLEDLHWSDVSTLDLLASLARRQERARLLVIGTYRPAEMLGEGDPLKGVVQELHAHTLCTEVALGLLSERHVEEYLQARFPGNALPTGLPQALYQRTEGNPLFLVNMVNDLVAQGVLVEVEGRWALPRGVEVVAEETPESIRHLIAKQSGQLLLTERQVLQAASVAGMEFSAAAVAAALETDVAEVEEWCAGLAARQHFLRSAGVAEWPDGTVSARYGFIHALYQQLWHERVSAEKVCRLHLRIGERQEAAYGQQAREIAAELAVHFEQGRDYQRAVRYLQLAGENATQRSAHVEALGHFNKGLTLLRTLPDAPTRTQQELLLQTTLGSVLIATKGFAAPEVEKAFTRARELCRQIGEVPQLFPVLRGLAAFYSVRANYRATYELGEQCLDLAQHQQNPLLLIGAHMELGASLFHMGEFVRALEHLEQGISLYDSQKYRSHAFLHGQDFGVSCLSRAAHVLWFLGYPDQALKRSQHALALAQELSHPHSLAYALAFDTLLHQLCGKGQTARERAEALITLSMDQGFPIWATAATILRGWVLATQGQGEEGIAQMRQGLTTWQAMGAEMAGPYFFSLQAEAYGKVGKATEGLALLAEALAMVDKNGEREHEAELYRLKGTLTLQSQASLGQVRDKSKTSQNKSEVPNTQHLTPSTQEAEAYFHKAIEIARRQQAKSLELRAVMSLVRLRQQQATQCASRTTQHEACTMLAAARNLLSEIYGWFTEGFDTKDLQEAKALLQEML